jgi:16S rRNA G966 N2-methylase RsmD
MLPHDVLQKKMVRLLGDRAHLAGVFKYNASSLVGFTSFKIGYKICEYLLSLADIHRGSVVTDAFAGIGGSTIPFMMHFDTVNAVERNPWRKEMLDHNIGIIRNDTGNDTCNDTMVNSTVTTYKAKYQTTRETLTQDIIFFDPPWGEYRYSKRARITITGETLEQWVVRAASVAKYCVVKVPFKYDIEYFKAELAGTGEVIRAMEFYTPNAMKILFVRYLQQLP